MKLVEGDLFEAGTGGYALYRIPGLVVTAKGTVLAYCEARKTGTGRLGHDRHHAAPQHRRRQDLGAAAEDRRRRRPEDAKNPVALAQKLAKPGEVTYNNPVASPIARPARSTSSSASSTRAASTCAATTTARRSPSRSRSPPTFEKFRPEYDWKVLATGPGHGIQLDNGRLLVPVWLSPAPAATRIGLGVVGRSTATTTARPGSAATSRAEHARVRSIPTRRSRRTGRRPGDAQRPQRIASPSPARHRQPGRRDRLEQAAVRRRAARADLHGEHRPPLDARPRATRIASCSATTASSAPAIGLAFGDEGCARGFADPGGGVCYTATHCPWTANMPGGGRRRRASSERRDREGVAWTQPCESASMARKKRPSRLRPSAPRSGPGSGWRTTRARPERSPVTGPQLGSALGPVGVRAVAWPPAPVPRLARCGYARHGCSPDEPDGAGRRDRVLALPFVVGIGDRPARGGASAT